MLQGIDVRILIAGGAGYVGSALVPKLVERGYRVDVLDLLWFGRHLPEGVEVIERDIMDADQALLSNYDQVIFLAGLSNDPMAEFAPSKNFVMNAAAPAYLAYMAKRAGVQRYIFAGSCSVYGYTMNELYDETSRTTSDYAYGISKLQGEAACLQLQDDDFSVISLRKGTVCGYSPRMRLDLVINTMFAMAISEQRIVVNNPAIWRPVLSIRDAVAAYIRAVEASHEVSGIFNIASGNFTVGELADLVLESVAAHTNARARLEIKDLRDFRNYKVDFSKAERVLSFKPQHDVGSIVRDLFDNLSSFEDFDNPRYRNIETFQALEGNR